jgi:hypothetical protein
VGRSSGLAFDQLVPVPAEPVGPPGSPGEDLARRRRALVSAGFACLFPRPRLARETAAA